MTTATDNGTHPRRGRPPKNTARTIDECQHDYEQATTAVAAAEKAERRAADQLAAATAAYDTARHAHQEAARALDTAEDAKTAARAELRKAQGRTA